MMETAEIEAAFLAACRDEIEAPKPGNVHAFSPGHGMTAEHFLVSAAAAAAPLCTAGKPVGQRIHDAVAASFAAVGMNTNLGILLLCAPLAAAAESAGAELQTKLTMILDALDTDDTRHVFAAIRLANPGGLGTSPRHDVHGTADVALSVAMAEAAERDRIALQYVTKFDDVFVTGLSALDAALSRGLKPPWSTVAVYLNFLAAFHDSHILRKYGADTAREVQREATQMLRVFHARHDNCLAELLGFDEKLKSRHLNPGTSADLTVATLFADRLRNILLKRHNDG